MDVDKLFVAIDMLEILQTESEVLSVDEIYEILEDVIVLLVAKEEGLWV